MYLFPNLFIFIFIYSFIYFYIYFYIYIFMYLFFHSFIYLFIYSFILLFIYFCLHFQNPMLMRGRVLPIQALAIKPRVIKLSPAIGATDSSLLYISIKPCSQISVWLKLLVAYMIK